MIKVAVLEEYRYLPYARHPPPGASDSDEVYLIELISQPHFHFAFLCLRHLFLRGPQCHHVLHLQWLSTVQPMSRLSDSTRRRKLVVLLTYLSRLL